MTKERALRVGEAIRIEVSGIIRDEIKDPRIGFVSVTAVEVSSDLRYAKIFVSIFGSDEDRERALAGLASSRGYIRSELGRRIRLRLVPEITFVVDHSLEVGDRISRLLKEQGERGGDA